MAQDWYQIKDELQQQVQGGLDDPMVWSNLAYAHLRCGDAPQARLAAEHALGLDANHVGAWVNLGASHLQAGRLEEAEGASRKVLSLAPDDAESYLFDSHVAREAGMINRAQQALLQAVRLDPSLADAWSQLALTQMDLGLSVQALNAIERAMALEPQRLRYHSNRLMIAQYHPELDSTALRKMAEQFGRSVQVEVMPPLAPRESEQPIKVAYLGPDFRAHPVGYILRDVIASHDPEHVEASIWNLHRGSDWLSDEYRALPLEWHDVVGHSDKALAQAIRDAGIDVLVDLAGHTAHNRLGVIARRPARVQLSFLGWFGAIGVPGLDGLLMGADQLTPGHEHAFAEPVLSLPGSHFRYRRLPYAPEIPNEEADGPLRLACFNNTAKLQPEVIDAWAEILRELPQSELELRWKTLSDPHVCQSLLRRFQAAGISAEQLVLRGACSLQELLAAYRDVHIALDPFPFSGGMTSLEALSMGVPVVTLAQLRAVSRQTHSMLRALDLEELSCERVKDYVDRAVSLGRDHGYRRDLRRKLINGFADSMLGDSRSLADELARCYRELLARREGR
ncbi:MAG: hypothetical protein AAGJ52_06265 [Pseudomonadota bacterium]